MRLFALLALALLLSLSIAPGAVDADEKRAVKYSFPTPIAGTDFGRTGLVAAVAKSFRAKDLVSELFRPSSDLEMAKALRSWVGPDELKAIDSELKDVNLASLVAASRSDYGLWKELDKRKVDAGNIRRAMEKAFEEFYPEECAAYFVQQGLSEKYLSARLAGDETIARRLDELEKAADRDADKPDRVWSDLTIRASFEETLGLYLSLKGKPDLKEVKAILDDLNLILTPEFMRVLKFGDAKLALKLMEANRITKLDFERVIEKQLKDARTKGESLKSIEMIEVARQREHSRMEWLRTRNINTKSKDVHAVFRGGFSGFETLPDLSHFDPKGANDWKKLPDLGISGNLLDNTKGQEVKLVVYTNNSARAILKGKRYEGFYDPEKSILTLSPVYHSAKTIALNGISILGEGLFMKLQFAEERKRRHLLLIRDDEW